jgi:hypothetical protein
MIANKILSAIHKVLQRFLSCMVLLLLLLLLQA